MSLPHSLVASIVGTNKPSVKRIGNQAKVKLGEFVDSEAGKQIVNRFHLGSRGVEKAGIEAKDFIEAAFISEGGRLVAEHVNEMLEETKRCGNQAKANIEEFLFQGNGKQAIDGFKEGLHNTKILSGQVHKKVVELLDNKDNKQIVGGLKSGLARAMKVGVEVKDSVGKFLNSEDGKKIIRRITGIAGIGADALKSTRLIPTNDELKAGIDKMKMAGRVVKKEAIGKLGIEVDRKRLDIIIQIFRSCCDSKEAFENLELSPGSVFKLVKRTLLNDKLIEQFGDKPSKLLKFLRRAMERLEIEANVGDGLVKVAASMWPTFVNIITNMILE